MEFLTFDNPLFVTYAIAASIMVLKLVVQGWITVFHILTKGRGFVNPEDALPSLFFPQVNEAYLEEDARVERSRRVHRNDLENIPAFLVIGLLFVLTKPSLILAQWLIYGFVAVRLAHTVSYEAGIVHDIRAATYIVGSLINAFMAVWTLYSIV